MRITGLGIHALAQMIQPAMEVAAEAEAPIAAPAALLQNATLIRT
jgi:hypothetical protein